MQSVTPLHTHTAFRAEAGLSCFSKKQLCLLQAAKLWRTHLSNPEEEVCVYSRWHYSLAWRRLSAKESSWWHYSQARNRVAPQERNFITGCFQFSSGMPTHGIDYYTSVHLCTALCVLEVIRNNKCMKKIMSQWLLQDRNKMKLKAD